MNIDVDSPSDVDIDNSTNQFSEQQVVDRKNYSEVYWLQNDSKRFSENITNALKYILGLYDFNVGYISNHIKEWHGIVDSIDLNENKFKVLFVDPSDKEGEYLVEFNISNIQYESDKDLLIKGAHIVWIYGQERRVIKRANENKLGPITNVSKIIVRRTRALNRKQLEEADENAQQWTRFFNGSET